MTKRKSRPTERETAERTMRELANVLSQDAPAVADLPFTLHAEADDTPHERQADLFGADAEPSKQD